MTDQIVHMGGIVETLEELVKKTRDSLIPYKTENGTINFHPAVFGGVANVPLDYDIKYVPNEPTPQYELQTLVRRLADIATNMAIASTPSNETGVLGENLPVVAFSWEKLYGFLEEMQSLRQELASKGLNFTAEKGGYMQDGRPNPIWTNGPLFINRSFSVGKEEEQKVYIEPCLNPIVMDILRDSERRRQLVGNLNPELQGKKFSNLLRYFSLLNVLDTFRSDSSDRNYAGKIEHAVNSVYRTFTAPFPTFDEEFWDAADLLAKRDPKVQEFMGQGYFNHSILTSGRKYIIVGFDAKGFNKRNRADMEEKSIALYELLKGQDLSNLSQDVTREAYSIITSLLTGPDRVIADYNLVLLQTLRNRFGSEKVLGRLGGDESFFAVEVDGSENESAGYGMIIDKIKQEINESLGVELRSAYTSYESDGSVLNLANTLKAVDIGLKRAKAKEWFQDNRTVYSPSDKAIVDLDTTISDSSPEERLNSLLDIKNNSSIKKSLTAELFIWYEVYRLFVENKENSEFVDGNAIYLQECFKMLNPMKPIVSTSYVGKLQVAGSFEAPYGFIEKGRSGILIGRKQINDINGQTNADDFFRSLNLSMQNFLRRHRLNYIPQRNGQGYIS